MFFSINNIIRSLLLPLLMNLVASFEEIVRNLRSEHRAAFHNHHTEQTSYLSIKITIFLPTLHHHFCLFSTAFHSAWDHICWFFDVWMNDNRGGKVAGRKKHANSTQSKGEDEGGGEAAPCLPSCLPCFYLRCSQFPVSTQFKWQSAFGSIQAFAIATALLLSPSPFPPQLHQRGVWLIITSSNCTYCHEKLIMQHLTIEKRLTLSQA